MAINSKYTETVKIDHDNNNIDLGVHVTTNTNRTLGSCHVVKLKLKVEELSGIVFAKLVEYSDSPQER